MYLLWTVKFFCFVLFARFEYDRSVKVAYNGTGFMIHIYLRGLTFFEDGVEEKHHPTKQDKVEDEDCVLTVFVFSDPRHSLVKISQS